MSIELAISVVIVGLAIYIFIKNVKKKTSGKCDCSSCPSNCSGCDLKENNKDKVYDKK